MMEATTFSDVTSRIDVAECAAAVRSIAHLLEVTEMPLAAIPHTKYIGCRDWAAGNNRDSDGKLKCLRKLVLAIRNGSYWPMLEMRRIVDLLWDQETFIGVTCCKFVPESFPGPVEFRRASSPQFSFDVLDTDELTLATVLGSVFSLAAAVRRCAEISPPIWVGKPMLKVSSSANVAECLVYSWLATPIIFIEQQPCQKTLISSTT